MGEALAVWQIDVKRWWPESLDPEDGEPAMPHDTFFDREMPLYVEWDYYSKRWIVPHNKTYAFKFEGPWSSPLRLETEVAAAKKAAVANLLSADALLAVSTAYSSQYIGSNTPVSIIEKCEQSLLDILVKEHGQTEDSVRRSPLCEWPLYHFVTLPAEYT